MARKVLKAISTNRHSQFIGRTYEELEELEEIKAYDAAKKSGSEVIPFEDAISQIDRNRK